MKTAGRRETGGSQKRDAPHVFACWLGIAYLAGIHRGDVGPETFVAGGVT